MYFHSHTEICLDTQSHIFLENDIENWGWIINHYCTESTFPHIAFTKAEAFVFPMGSRRNKRSITLKVIKGILHVNLTTTEETQYHCWERGSGEYIFQIQRFTVNQWTIQLFNMWMYPVLPIALNCLIPPLKWCYPPEHIFNYIFH